MDVALYAESVSGTVKCHVKTKLYAWEEKRGCLPVLGEMSGGKENYSWDIIYEKISK